VFYTTDSRIFILKVIMPTYTYVIYIYMYIYNKPVDSDNDNKIFIFITGLFRWGGVCRTRIYIIYIYAFSISDRALNGQTM